MLAEVVSLERHESTPSIASYSQISGENVWPLVCHRNWQKKVGMKTWTNYSPITVLLAQAWKSCYLHCRPLHEYWQGNVEKFSTQSNSKIITKWQYMFSFSFWRVSWLGWEPTCTGQLNLCIFCSVYTLFSFKSSSFCLWLVFFFKMQMIMDPHNFLSFL